ncbi:MAG: hypothetical protein FIB02_00325 [Desulfuromonas sp.]|nr:hypothetical protein [Desulfuromonas sp.]
MIDYHCHLLPGLDDGPESVDESVDMARALAAFGFREVCCTPHCIKGHYELSPVEVREAVRKLQSRLDCEGVALRLHGGMEYYLDECFEQFAANLLPLGASRVVLCEAPPQAPPGLVADMAGLIVVQGYIPLVAHPERTEVMWKMLEERDESQAPGSRSREPGAESPAPRAGWLRRLFSRAGSRPVGDSALSTRNSVLGPGSTELPEGTLFQANLGSFTGYYGPIAQRRAYELLQRGTYHCLASDLHEARSAADLLELAREKLTFNPALQQLGNFRAPAGQGGSDQLAFW